MFDHQGDLDLDATAQHVDWLVGSGAHGVVVAGTSGEFISLGLDERLALIKRVVDVVAGRVPVIAGTGTASTAGTIALTREAARAGAGGAIVILPYYQRPSRLEVIEHLAAVGRVAPIPVMIYNNPTNSAAPGLSAHDLSTLHRDGVASGVKSTFPEVHQVHEALAATTPDFRVFYGSFMAPLEALAGGAHGWISGILNVVLPDALELWDAVVASDLARARTAWARIAPIRALYVDGELGQVSDLAIYRGILRLRGLPAGRCRPPLLELDAEGMDRLERSLGAMA